MLDGFWTDERFSVTVRYPDGQSTSFNFERPFITIGSSEACDLVIDAPGIPGKAFCVCLDSMNRLWGALLQRRSRRSKIGFRRIDTSRSIAFGGLQLDFDGPPTKPNSPTLYEIDSTDSTQYLMGADHRVCVIKWKIDDDTELKKLRPHRPVLLGRDLPSQLIVRHDSVSVAHCALLFDGEFLWVADAGSTNKVRTLDGSASHLRLSDRQIFAVGRAQIKIAIPTNLVPLSELEKLRSDIAKNEMDFAAINEARNDLQRRQAELQDWVDQLRNEQDVWLRRRDAVNREIEERLIRLEGREESLSESIREWESHQTEMNKQLSAKAAEIERKAAEIDLLATGWNTRQAETDKHWQGIAEEVKRHKLAIRQQKYELQSESERLVVQRLRTQKDLKQREQELADRERELIRKEILLESVQRRVPRDVSGDQTQLEEISDLSISDSTVLAANDFVEILGKAIKRTDDTS